MVAAAGVALAALAGTVSAQEACAVREVERWAAQLSDGSHVYVEPTDLVESEGRMLLAGTPTYLHPAGRAGGDSPVVSSLAGIVLGPGRRAEPVPWPLTDRHLRVLRAARAQGGGWMLLLAETDRRLQMPDSASLVALWYGRWDGTRWSDVERIPQPPRPGAIMRHYSSVVPFGDGFAWAIPYTAGPDDRGAQVLFREGGGWRWERIAASHGIYVELWSDDGALRASLVATDHAVRRDTNSLMVFVRDPHWRTERLLIRGGEDGVYNPRAVSTDGRVALTWRRHISPDWHAQAVLDAAADSVALMTIDPSMSYMDAFTGADGRAVWVTEHVAADDGRTLFFAQDSGGRIRSLGEAPSPYKGHFAAEQAGNGALLIAGPRFTTDPAEVPLVTLVLRYSIDCPGD